MSQSPQADLRFLTNALWRGHPLWPSTFSKCPTPACTKAGRGGNYCVECVEKQLAQIVGEEDAAEYHNLIKQISALGRKFYDNAEEKEN